jgi:hypothetical protein
MKLSDVDRRALVQRADAAREEAVRIPVVLAVAELRDHHEHLLELVQALIPVVPQSEPDGTE